MRFWDSSAVVPLLVEEPAGAQLLSLAKSSAGMAVWWGTQIECTAAVARREREYGLDAKAASAALNDLHALARSWDEIAPSAQLRVQAIRLLRKYPLRTADALQLAAALAFANHEPAGLDFVCLDRRLADAAAREGFTVVGL